MKNVPFIKYGKEPFFIPLVEDQISNWYEDLEKLLSLHSGGDQIRGQSDNVFKHIGYGRIAGPTVKYSHDPDATGNLIAFADVREAKEGEHDSRWPYIFDHEFLYLSRNYRENISRKGVGKLIEELGYDREKTFTDNRQHLAEYDLNPYEMLKILEKQLSDPNLDLLRSRNEFYLEAKLGYKFRVKVYYQKPTAKRYKKASILIWTPDPYQMCDSWHGSVEGRVFFSCGHYRFRKKE